MFSRRKTCTIPKEWLDQVTEILWRGKDDEIEWTVDGFQGWHLYGTHDDAHGAMAQSLVPGVQGRLVKMPIDEGETYAFFFTTRGKQMYGKICLIRGEKKLIIFSAHEPEKKDL